MADIGNLPPGPVSGRALARLLGLRSDNAVRSAVKAGRLRRSVLPDGRFDAALAIAEWQANTDPRQQRRTTAATDAAAASDARRARKPEGGAPAGAPAPSRPRRRSTSKTTAGGPPSGSVPAGAEVIDLHTRSARQPAAGAPEAASPTSPRRPPRPARPTQPRDHEDLAAAGDDRTMADIRRSMLLVDEQVQAFDWGVKLGLALPRDPIVSAVQTLGREFRDATLRIADQYSAQIAADLGVEAHVCHEVLDRYLRDHFEGVIVKIDVLKVLGDDDGDADA